MIKLFQAISKNKEIVLSCISILYGLGYLIWAINSYQNNLGLLPAFEFQYLISGIGPFLILILMVFSLSKAKLLIESIYKITEHRLSRKILEPVSMLITIVYLTVYYKFGIKYKYFQLEGSSMESGLAKSSIMLLINIFIGIILIYQTNSALTVKEGIVSNRKRELIIRLYSFLKPKMLILVRVALYGTIILETAVLIIYYSLVIYPRIPQEFGGVKAKEAYISFKSEPTNQDGLELLKSDSASLSGKKFYQVYYKNSEVIVIKDASIGAPFSDKTLEIKISDINWIIWRDRGVKAPSQAEFPMWMRWFIQG